MLSTLPSEAPFGDMQTGPVASFGGVAVSFGAADAALASPERAVANFGGMDASFGSAMATSPAGWQGSPQSPTDSVVSVGPGKWRLGSHGLVVTEITSATSISLREQQSSRGKSPLDGPLSSACKSVALNSLVSRLQQVVQKQQRAALRHWERGWAGIQQNSRYTIERPVAEVLSPVKCSIERPVVEVLSPVIRAQVLSPTGRQSVPMAVAGVDVTHNGRADLFYIGADRNRDGIPDALQGPNPRGISVVGLDTSSNVAYGGADQNYDSLRSFAPGAPVGLSQPGVAVESIGLSRQSPLWNHVTPAGPFLQTPSFAAAQQLLALSGHEPIPARARRPSVEVAVETVPLNQGSSGMFPVQSAAPNRGWGNLLPPRAAEFAPVQAMCRPGAARANFQEAPLALGYNPLWQSAELGGNAAMDASGRGWGHLQPARTQ